MDSSIVDLHTPAKQPSYGDVLLAGHIFQPCSFTLAHSEISFDNHVSAFFVFANLTSVRGTRQSGKAEGTDRNCSTQCDVIGSDVNGTGCSYNVYV